MSDPYQRNTRKAPEDPSVLIVGSTPELLASCERVASRVGAILYQASVDGAATAATEHRPLVVIVPRPVHDFDSEAFGALARDIGALLLVIDAGVPDIETERRILQAVLRACRGR